MNTLRSICAALWVATAAPAQGAGVPPAATDPPPPDRENVWLGVAFGAYIVGLAACVLFVQPAIRRRPLNRTLALLPRDPAGYPAAEEQLAAVLKVGLRRKDVGHAEVALAYLRARMKKYDEASAVLTEHLRTARPGPDALYLHIWLLARLKKFRDVEAVYEKHGDALGDFLDAKMIFGVAILNHAKEHRKNREIDGAVACFRTLRELGVLIEHIPDDIDDHPTILGVLALFDKNAEEARDHFTKAAESLREAGRTRNRG